MKEKFVIGKLIENEVRRQQWSITKFADAICCQRSNIYDIFKRNNIDILLLARICKVLKYNYFQDIIDNFDLIESDYPETRQDFVKEKAAAQFLDVVPTVLHNLKMSPTITLPNKFRTEDIPLPDFSLPSYGIYFTVGEQLTERLQGKEKENLEIEKLDFSKDISVELWKNKSDKTSFLNVAIDYKTQQDWEKTLQIIRNESLQLVKVSQEEEV